MRSIVLSAALAVMIACRSTPAPGCTDQYGRGSDQPDTLNISCTTIDADMQCSAVATNTGGLYVYCPVTLSVTGQSAWKSSDVSVAAFTGSPPGFLKVLTSGRIEVSATYGFLQGSAGTYAVAPGTTPERMIQVSVIVEDSRTAARVPDVLIDIFPERGAEQTCMTNQFGGCLPFPLVLSGTTRIKALKAGYVSIETSLPPLQGSLFQSTIIKLSPL